MTRASGQLRSGYTLIELLVVVMIVLILIAATLPVAKRVMDSSRPREASRQLNAHLAMARAYAARNNRPFGLWMEYDPPVGWVDVPGNQTLRQVTRVYLAEVQPPYSGSTTSSRAIIRIPQNQSLPEFVPLTNSTDMSGNVIEDTTEKTYFTSSTSPLVEPGETFWVKFDFKGDWFRCIRGQNGNALGYTDPNRLYLYMLTAGMPASASMTGSSVPPAYNSHFSFGFRFQILREPRRVGSPLELASGTCIDVEHSGMGPTGYNTPGTAASIDGGFGEANNRLVLLFSPSGGIDGIYLDSTPLVPTGTIHFLVGKVEKVNLPTGPNTNHPSGFNAFDPATSNLADTNSLWVSVGRLNGSITTSENVPDAEHGVSHPNPWSTAGQAEYLEECRAVATGREQMGGQ